jgi:hypothetical protein
MRRERERERRTVVAFYKHRRFLTRDMQGCIVLCKLEDVHRRYPAVDVLLILSCVPGFRAHMSHVATGPEFTALSDQSNHHYANPPFVTVSEYLCFPCQAFCLFIQCCLTAQFAVKLRMSLSCTVSTVQRLNNGSPTQNPMLQHR